MRLAIVASHPIQYQAPLFRELTARLELDVLYAHRASAADQSSAGFGVAFEWDSDLLSGYSHFFLNNVSAAPSPSRFAGCDTPDLGKRLASGGYDAVLVMGWQLKSFWQAVIACRRLRIPVMVRGDSQLTTPRLSALIVAKRLVYPLGLRAFAAALYVGQRSRDYFRAYGYPTERLFFSPHSVDDGWFTSRATLLARRALRQRLSVPDDETLLLFAGKLVDFKRPLDLVSGAACLRARGRRVSVLVAGSGPLERMMRREAASADVPLHMMGFLNQSEMPAAYAASDMLVLPSTGRETWGLVANEALACSRPIAVSDAVGCAPDLAANRTVGRSFRLGNVADLAEAVQDILSRPPEAEAFASTMRRYSHRSAADGIAAALDACVHHRAC
jgi:glycosyltransferase involved in cell wall biosynthesis